MRDGEYRRLPRDGEKIALAGHAGKFEVATVRRNPHVVDLRLLHCVPEHIERNVPWDVLSYLDEEDFGPVGTPIA
jgi:hypothetical protein